MTASHQGIWKPLVVVAEIVASSHPMTVTFYISSTLWAATAASSWQAVEGVSQVEEISYVITLTFVLILLRKLYILNMTRLDVLQSHMPWPKIIDPLSKYTSLLPWVIVAINYFYSNFAAVLRRRVKGRLQLRTYTPNGVFHEINGTCRLAVIAQTPIIWAKVKYQTREHGSCDRLTERSTDRSQVANCQLWSSIISIKSWEEGNKAYEIDESVQ